MIFTVVWTATAERALTAISVDAEDRNVVTRAANLLDRQLRIDPAARCFDFHPPLLRRVGGQQQAGTDWMLVGIGAQHTAENV